MNLLVEPERTMGVLHPRYGDSPIRVAGDYLKR